MDATDNIEETRCLTRRIPAPVFVLTPACALRPDKGWAFAVNGPGPWYGLMQLHPHITRSTADATPHRGVHQTLNFVHLQIPVSGASREGGGARGRSKMHANRKIPQSGRETRGQSPEPRRRLPFVSMREPEPRCGPHPHFTLGQGSKRRKVLLGRLERAAKSQCAFAWTHHPSPSKPPLLLVHRSRTLLVRSV